MSTISETARLVRGALAEVEEFCARASVKVGDLHSLENEFDPIEHDRIVLGYVDHNEFGAALEHLIYMAEEYELPLSRAGSRLIEQAALAMRMHPRDLERLQVRIVDR